MDVVVRSDRAPGRCAYCKDGVEKQERAACAGCMALHHLACFREHGACAACGDRDLLAQAGAEAPPLEPVPSRSGRCGWQEEPLPLEPAPPRSGRYGWQEEPAQGFSSGLAVLLFVVLPLLALLLFVGAALR